MSIRKYDAGFLSLITRNTHKRLTSMAQAGFEPAILISERMQTQALDRAIYLSPT